MDGGKKAAGLLKQAVEEKLKTTSAASVHHLQVIVRVYANMKGLDKTYKELQILPDSTTIDDFVRGFNMGYSMCDYVDAGNGKECSDEKVKGKSPANREYKVGANPRIATFRLHLEDIHCHKILFGGTADNGYARMLEPYLQNETDRSRITLLEGPPSAQELAKIRDRFETLSFANIFRTQKLPDTKRRVSFLMTPPRTPPVDYAAAVSKAPAAGSSVQSNALIHVPSQASSGKVLRNAQGQRVDSPLSYSQSDYINLKPRKLCNSFHLLGRCAFVGRNGSCSHRHGESLGQKQTEALRAISRQSPCSYGLSCSDSDCIFGHRCTRPNCEPSNCRFGLDMHQVDIKIVG